MLMKRLLICPSERPGMSLLARQGPLATVPLLGQALIEYWLSALAACGAKHVTVLAHDRPERVRDITGDGTRWGLTLKLIEESRELSPAQALLKYPGEVEDPAQNGIAVLDHFPGLPERNIFAGYGELHSALQEWMPRARTPDRVGVREASSGVWVDSHSAISPEATLRGPCWIGRHVYIGPGAAIGPHSVVEDGAFIEGRVEVAESSIGPDTFVGAFARIESSFAWGGTLIDWRTDSVIEVPDCFLLCSLRQQNAPRNAGWFARLAELYTRNKGEVGLLWKHLLLNKES
jgi:NDP-sugar pyrophosphorylase family protein